MKLRFIISEWLEGKGSILAKKHGLDLKTLTMLGEADPTPTKKYLDWIIKQYISKKSRFPEDSEKFRDSLTKLSKARGIEKDINKYLSFSELAKALESVGMSNRELKHKGRAGELVLPPGAETVLEEGGYTVIRITDPKASSILCSGTEWCVANIDTAQEHLNSGPLYLVYRDNKRHKLIHFPTGQFMNVYDDMAKWDEVKSYLIMLKQFDDIRKYPTGMVFIALNAGSGDSNGFPDEPNTQIRIRAFEPYIAKDPKAAMEYAIDVLQKLGESGKFPEAEVEISKDPDVAVEYATKVLKERFSAAETTIASSAKASLRYCKNILKLRWRACEPVMLKEPRVAVDYTQLFIRPLWGRWREAEPYILKDAEAAYRYAMKIIGKPWPEAEPVILNQLMKPLNTEGYYVAPYYAKDVLDRRWPEAEKAFKAMISSEFVDSKTKSFLFRSFKTYIDLFEISDFESFGATKHQFDAAWKSFWNARSTAPYQ